jgi:hypothetical protein
MAAKSYVNPSQSPHRYPYSDVSVGLARSHDPETTPAVAYLLIGSPMPDRSKVMLQTKEEDALVLQVGVGVRLTIPLRNSHKCLGAFKDGSRAGTPINGDVTGSGPMTSNRKRG